MATAASNRLADVAAVFDGSRLTVARHLAGLRKNGLASLVGKSPTAIASFESDSKRPTSSTIAQLALALDVDPEFFLPRSRDHIVLAAQPHFRSLRSTSQVSRDQALAYGQLALDVAAAIERYVEFPPRDIPYLSVAPEDSEGDLPEQAAISLRKAWDLPPGPVGHLVRYVENRGGLVVFSPVAVATVDAYSFDTPTRPAILLNPLKGDYYRQRFDVAHELGHIVMHVDSEPGGRKLEDQANRFAAEFLMPERDILDELPHRIDWQKLGRLKERWNVSLQALLYRARQLGVMAEVTYRNAISSMTSRGWRRREPGQAKLLEQPSLLPSAVALLSAEARIEERHLAAECRVPLRLFRSITARNPSFDPDILAPPLAANEPQEE